MAQGTGDAVLLRLAGSACPGEGDSAPDFPGSVITSYSIHYTKLYDRRGPGVMPMEKDRKIALLIDCDNASYQAVDGVLNELAKYGVTNIRRAYGNSYNFV